jgi:hypothetical protein
LALIASDDKIEEDDDLRNSCPVESSISRWFEAAPLFT